jgi:hypothetical protein
MQLLYFVIITDHNLVILRILYFVIIVDYIRYVYLGIYN